MVAIIHAGQIGFGSTSSYLPPSKPIDRAVIAHVFSACPVRFGAGDFPANSFTPSTHVSISTIECRVARPLGVDFAVVVPQGHLLRSTDSHRGLEVLPVATSWLHKVLTPAFYMCSGYWRACRLPPLEGRYHEGAWGRLPCHARTCSSLLNTHWKFTLSQA